MKGLVQWFEKPHHLWGHLILGVLALMVFPFISCQTGQAPPDDDLIAQVYDHKLYHSDIAGTIPPGTSAEDSAQMTKIYLNNWIQQHVILHHALENMNPEDMDFEKKIQEYKTSLIVYAFETQLVRQYLDTLITDSQISEYYEEHKNSFMLRENIVRVIYVKVPLDTPEIGRFRNLYRSTDPDELVQLEEYCVQHAASYLIDGDAWLLFQDILREIPITTNNQESYLRSNKYIELSDSYYRYFLHILDYRLKGSISPLAFERENIKSIILNQRKHKLIGERRNQYLEQAINDGQMETFY